MTDLRPNLALEHLEDRCAPATCIFSGSTLTISNPRIVAGAATLTVNQLAAGRFQVLDNGSPSGTFSNVSNITINGSTANDTISVSILAAGSLSGNLTINSGNGNDTVNVNGNASGEIKGALAIDGGNGGDTINVGNTTALSVRGATTLAAGLGADTANVAGGGASTFYGTLSYYGFNTYNPNAANITLLSGLTLSHRAGSPASSQVKLIAETLTLTKAVPGLLKVDWGVLNQSLTVQSASVGSLSVAMGSGNDSVSLDTTVLGNAGVTFGTGDGTIGVTAATTINSNKIAGQGLGITMGNGVNVYNLNNAFQVYGNTTINATQGTNDQDITFGGVVSKTVVTATDGNLTVNTGYGDDSFTFDATADVENTMTVNLGEMNNEFTTVNGSAFKNLTFTAGDGNNVVDLYIPNSSLTRAITLTFGAGGTNSVNIDGGTGGGGTITINWTDAVADDTLTTNPFPYTYYTITENGTR